ncbi:hypothetical protein C2E23DRAFT_729774 [Lenzites betulinus]|nr:hypothetical protein C2E23DRAFT_729774 [Lenzites betulinus]
MVGTEADVAQAVPAGSSGTPDVGHGPRRPVTVEDVPDDEVEQGGLPRKPWIEDYPGNAGHAEPTRTRTKPSFESNYMFYKKIDMLPTGEASWRVELLEAVGDVVGEDGCVKKETVEVWSRDPVDCVRELMDNPGFHDSIRYAPERQYADINGKQRIYGNMGTANWWWDARMPEGATVAPVILASDKTTLSRMSGDKSAWPVYLTIGNIDKDVRRKPSAHATVLLGYLPVTKLECYSEKRRALEGYRLFHLCMSKMLEPLVAAGRDGVMMTCPDGRVRRVFPILAAYIADHPEQCLVSGCQENYCPKCPIGPNGRGEPAFSALKDPARVTAILKRAAEGRKPPEFTEWGLRAVVPFWTELPHADIFSALTPDILHQLHKGIFKDHLVSWATQAIEDGSDEVDRRFKAMLKHSDLRHFNKGISLVSQWTGTEYKNMEKVFLGVVAGAGDERVTRTVRAVLDFIYYAHFETHTDASLDALHAAWKDYHKYKTVFVELEIRQHFNFPKGHSTEHYEPSIRSLGTADGYSTEHPERLHIDFAKLAYGASNKKSTYIQQMTRWLQRQEAVHRFARYLAWASPSDVPSGALEPPSAPAPISLASASRTSQAGPQGRPEPHAPPSSPPNPSVGVPTTGLRAPGASAGTATDEAEDIWRHGYRVAKEPAFPSLTVTQIVHEFGATTFKVSLAEYLKKLTASNPRRAALVATPIHDLTRIAAYKQFKVQLPTVRQVTKNTLIDIVHASPSRLGPRPLQLRVPANMSTVFARDTSSALVVEPARPFNVARPLAGMSSVSM